MRDGLIHANFLPIVQEEMDGLAVTACIKGYTNVSNGYYGYQPTTTTTTTEEKTNCDRMEVVQVTFDRFVEEDVSRAQCRKRAWEYGPEAAEFKKRRENESVRKCAENKIDENSKERKLCVLELEDVLRETHGCEMYHWTSDYDL